MKKWIALGLAGVMTATAIAATTTSASARHRGYLVHRSYGGFYGGYGHYNNITPFNNVAPFLFGSIFGMMLTQPYYAQPYGYYPNYAQPYAYHPNYARRYAYNQGNPHVAWCLSRYRTYNPATNLFFIRRGVQAVCISPY